MELNTLSKVRDIEVYVGTYGDKWIAASGHSPYFCFEVDSLDELDAKLGRLTAFLGKAAIDVRKRAERERSESKSFVFTKKITLKRLEEA